VSKDTRSFETTLSGLGELKGWLEEQGCKVVGMESTGVYWKPVYHVLEEQFEVTVANPRDLRQRRGKKTDKMDAAWISELLAHGLVPNSFIPPREIAALRDLTRTAAALVQTRTQAKNRVHKVLEDTNIKLASVVTDLFGKSARAMLDALINGERNPRRLAQLALGRLRNKLPELQLSLCGRFSEHHGAIIRMALAQIDLYDQQLAELDRRTTDLTYGPFGALTTIRDNHDLVRDESGAAIGTQARANRSSFSMPTAIRSEASIPSTWVRAPPTRGDAQAGSGDAWCG
jgi:transposase